MHKKYVALVGASALTLTLGLSGCSSDSTPTAAAAENTAAVQGPGVSADSGSIARPEAPVRVGVEEFANVITAPGVVILDPGCTAKTYPNYFEDLARICGSAN